MTVVRVISFGCSRASFRPSSRPPSVRSFSWSFCGSLTAEADGDLPLRLAPSLPLPTAHLADRPAHAGDEPLAAGELGFRGGETRSDPPLLERQHIDAIRFGIDPRRVAYDVDEPIKRMQAAEKIIVFAVGTRQKRGEMAEPNTLQALDTVESAKRMDVLRTDAVDQNLVELAQLARARHRERQYVPEWKAEIIDQHLASRIRMPLGRIERRQQIVELAGARIEIDLGGQSFDQPIDLVDVLLHESRRKGFEMLDLRGRGRGRKRVRHQVTDLAAVKVGILPAPQRIETNIELALESIDHERIEADETILTDELIKPVLPLD